MIVASRRWAENKEIGRRLCLRTASMPLVPSECSKSSVKDASEQRLEQACCLLIKILGRLLRESRIRKATVTGMREAVAQAAKVKPLELYYVWCSTCDSSPVSFYFSFSSFGGRGGDGGGAMGFKRPDWS